MAEVRKGLSVAQRLSTLGAAALLGFASMIGVGWYESVQVENALKRGNHAQANARHINEMRLTNQTLILAAMDSIVDKQERQIEAGRMASIVAASRILDDGSADVIAFARETGNAAVVATFDDDIASVRKAIEVDLRTMIEAGAPDTEFDKIDDTIDGAGARVGATLTTLYTVAGGLLEERVHEANVLSNQSLYVQLGLGIIAILIMIALQIVHGGSLRRGIAGVRTSMQKILDGDYTGSVAEAVRGDEIGDMARATDQFRLAAVEKQRLERQSGEAQTQNETERRTRDEARLADEQAIRSAVDALADGLARLSDGDLQANIDQPFRPDLERLREDFNRTTARLQDVMIEISSNTGSIQANSNQMRSAADDLARRTEQQAASLEQTSAALDQITTTVRHASEHAEEVGHMVEGTRKNTQKSGQVVGDAMSAMGRIEDASREISKIINVIDEIAFQTNLLALNAGVEAARAGEAGKGFAVVAQEVRELAGRAAGAAKDIKALINKSSSEVRTGVELVTATGEVLRHIGEDVAQINDHVKSIVTSTREQTVGLSEINTAVSQMDQVTQKNAAMVEETNAASHTLASDAENLSRVIGQFKIRGGSPRRAPQVASATSRPASSPARNLVSKVAGAFNRSNTVAQPEATGEHWEEF